MQSCSQLVVSVCISTLPLSFFTFFLLEMSDSMPYTSLCEHNSADGNNTPPWRKVRGKGKGGAGAKYCTMSPGTRKEQFPGHPLSVRTNDFGIEVLWCHYMKPHFPVRFHPHFFCIFLHFLQMPATTCPTPLPLHGLSKLFTSRNWDCYHVARLSCFAKVCFRGQRGHLHDRVPTGLPATLRPAQTMHCNWLPHPDLC